MFVFFFCREQEEAEKPKDESAPLDKGEAETKKKSKAKQTGKMNEDLMDLYDLDNYDSDEEAEGIKMTGAGMAGITYFASNSDDPYVTLKDPVSLHLLLSDQSGHSTLD